MRALSWNEVPSVSAPPKTRAAHGAPHPALHAAPAAPPLWLMRFHVIVALVAAVAAGLLGFTLFAHTTFSIGPGQVAVQARPAFPGTTTLSFPPFGSVSAETHRSPLEVTASLEEVDVTQLQRLALAGIPGTRTLDAYRGEAERGARVAVGKGLIAALVAGTFVGWAVRRSWRVTLAAGVLGLVVPTLLVAYTVTGFDANAFKSPRYTGALRYAPSLISLVQGRIERVGDLQKQINDAVGQLNAYYSHPQSFSSGGNLPNTMRVLQVSDLHLDPVGFKLESELADEFGVSFIIDAGDATDYATPLEATALQRFLDTRVPRIFVPGNHESPSVVRALDSLNNVTVIEDSATVTMDGLRVYGLADPMSHEESWTPDNAVTLSQATTAAADLEARIASGAPKPDVIVTHNPVGLQPFAGMSQLLVAGHTHTADLGKIGSSWYVNSGTVGGIDFKYLYSDPSIAHGASILYFTKTLPHRLVAIDQIAIAGRVDQSSLKRTVVDPTLLEQLKAPPATKPATKKAAAKK